MVFYEFLMRFQIVFTVVLCGEMIKVHQKFNRGQSPGKLGTYGKNQVDEFPAEAFQMFGCTAFPAQLCEAIQ